MVKMHDMQIVEHEFLMLKTLLKYFIALVLWTNVHEVDSAEIKLKKLYLNSYYTFLSLPILSYQILKFNHIATFYMNVPFYISMLSRQMPNVVFI